MLVLRTLNFQGATIRPIVPKKKKKQKQKQKENKQKPS